ncbi:hypothetical protein K470DRAFT_169698 [Piedraia hortae CBS 480.64]|uniref:Uncharacterized protein n=1 Tax=Piedraia hortae CBS 480.64 TaxID=1314780 RepID=A0A6A7BQS9_9PEZI|nr:hypothetical protein K470DRAFT_169698 [Piedraia hortae CBS 480.64]
MLLPERRTAAQWSGTHAFSAGVMVTTTSHSDEPKLTACRTETEAVPWSRPTMRNLSSGSGIRRTSWQQHAVESWKT